MAFDGSSFNRSKESTGLGAYRTGAPRVLTKARDGSRTQRRKAALASYDVNERKNGRITSKKG